MKARTLGERLVQDHSSHCKSCWDLNFCKQGLRLIISAQQEILELPESRRNTLEAVK